jgi:hypothetical protein
MTDQTGPAYPPAGIVFVGVMLVAGLALAFLFKTNPALTQALPGLMWLLAIALIYDVAVNLLSFQGKVAGPMPMVWRFGGFFAGAIVHVAVTAMLG